MRVGKDKINFSMDKNHNPVCKVKSGDSIIFETCDCFTDTIKSEDDLVSSVDFSRVNPATGPIYIEGAKKGDVLKVEIIKINVKESGVSVAVPNMGRLGGKVEKEETLVGKIVGDKIEIGSDRLDLNKMIGVIGTAPENDPVVTGTPDYHGGNMDCKMVKEGVSLYLPVNVEGALLSLGDLHACMGDGEIMGAGLEIAGEVELKVEILKDFSYKLPMIESEDAWISIGSAEDMEAASDLAIANMADFLMKKKSISLNQAGILLSLAGDLRVCQIVNPNRTMRMEFPKKYL